MEESVRIVNEGDTEFSYPYAGKIYTIPAGAERFYPWDVLVAWMGNPSLRNTEYDRWRDEAYQNLALFYGASTLEGIDPTKFPKLRAYDAEGNQIHTILDDPAGEHLPIEADSGGHDNASILSARMAEQAALVAELMARLDAAGISSETEQVPPAAPKPRRNSKRKTGETPAEPSDENVQVPSTPAGPITDEQPPADNPNIIRVGEK